MTSKCKSWCYQDMLLTPNEVSLYREVRQCGLGLIHIKSRCTAKLITVFLQTAANPRFMKSLLHNYLYSVQVSHSWWTSPIKPGLPPILYRNFLQYHQESQEWNNLKHCSHDNETMVQVPTGGKCNNERRGRRRKERTGSLSYWVGGPKYKLGWAIHL